MALAVQEIVTGPGDARGFSSVLFTRTLGFRFSGEGGRLETRTATLGDAGLRIGRVVSTGHRIEIEEESAIFLLFPGAGRLEVASRQDAARVGAGGIVAVRPGPRRTSVLAPDDGPFRAGTLALRPTTEAMRLLGASAIRRLVSAEAGRLGRYVAFLGRDLLAREAPPPCPLAETAVAAMLGDLLDAAIAAGPDGPDDPGLDEARVRAAEEIIRGRAGEPLSIAALAGELGVSQRSLQLAFRSRRGLTPRALLNRVRLEAARRRLAEGAGDSVTAIALDCGFTHLGRFSASYRGAFGELPKATFARAR